MNTELLIENFKKKFETKFDAGLIFKINPEEYNTCFIFEDDKILRGFGTRRENQFDLNTTDKRDVYRYLSAKYLEYERLMRRATVYGSPHFYEDFWAHWLKKYEGIKNTLSEISKYYPEEQIVSGDMVFTSIRWDLALGLRSAIHIINKRYITELLFSSFGREHNEVRLTHRIQHGIQRDVKRIEATSENLRIHFHGMHDPFNITFDTYKEVIELQRHLIELKNQSQFHNRNNR